MDRSKIFIRRREGFLVAAVEGVALSFKQGIQIYKNIGKYKDLANFSPVLLGESKDHDFFAVNIYGAKFCTLTGMQNRNNRYTSFVSIGNGEHAYEFFEDISDVFQLNPQYITIGLVEQSKISEIPLRALYKRAREKLKSDEAAAKLVSDSLNGMQEIYEHESNFLTKFHRRN